jgi:DNA mismatch endonuclease (patch repair protein)
MSSIKSKNNKSTEIILAKLMRKNHISGWRRHLSIPGTPDFAFQKHRIAIFVDGCFWHGCPKCYRKPKSKIKFWTNKIAQNITRDRRVTRKLQSLGWEVIRIRECELQKPNTQTRIINRILKDIEIFH